MNVFLVTFQAVVALLGIGILGFWVIGHRRVPDSTLGFLASLAIDVALPFLVLVNLIRDFSPEKFPNWWRLPIWWLGFSAVALAISLTAARLVKPGIRAEFTIGLFYQNALFFPLIIISGLFGLGNPYLVSLLVFTVFQPSLVFTTYPLFFRNNKPWTKELSWQRILNPVMLSTFMGMLVSLAALRRFVPAFVLTILTMVGAMATPLFMLILGGNIYKDFISGGNARGKFDIIAVSKFVIVKNLVFPLAFIALMVWFRPDPNTAFIIVLQAAVPPITAIPIFAERLGGNRTIASQFVIGSFIFSLVSIPAMLYVFSLFFPLN